MSETPRPHRPSVEEAVLGWLYGEDDPAADPDQFPVPRTPRQALERELGAQLAQGPCAVAFSGGRDSSVVLAVAVHVARSEGLPEPLPITLRYPSLPETDERSWQEQVVKHLKIPRWEIVDLSDENGFTGPHATSMLASFGPYFPFAAHTCMPLAREAGPRTVLTGEAGDLLLSPHRTWALANLVHRKGRVEAAAWRHASLAVAPRAWRSASAGRRVVSDRTWLGPLGAAAARRAAKSTAAAEPLSWAASTRQVPRLRALRRGLATLDVAYAMGGAIVTHPFLAPDFVASLASSYGPLGPLSRSQVVGDLAGDLLPAGVVTRRNKADFTRALLTADVRRLIVDWDGQVGVDSRFVEPGTLRAEWSKDRPAASSLQLLLEVVYGMTHKGASV